MLLQSPATENDDTKESPRMSPQAGEPTHRDPESIPPESSQPLSPIPLRNALGLVFDPPFNDIPSKYLHASRATTSDFDVAVLDGEDCPWDFDDFRIRSNMGGAS